MKGPIPQNILRLMSTQDRKPLGKAGATQPEIDSKQLAQRESKLQSDCALILRHAGIWYQRADMRHRTHNTPGCPDFLFAVNGYAVAVECKVGDGKLSYDQQKAANEMRLNGWAVEIVRTVEELRNILRSLGCDHTIYCDDRPHHD